MHVYFKRRSLRLSVLPTCTHTRWVLALSFPSHLSSSASLPHPTTGSPVCNGMGQWRATSFLALAFPKEEDAGLAQSKRLKRNKAVVFQMGRRKKRKEEDQEDTDDEDENPEGAPTSLQSPRMSQKPHLYSRTRPRRPREHVRVLESSLSKPTSKTQPCPWSLAWFYQYLCSCCHRRHKSVGENEALDSTGRRDLDERGMVPGSACEQRSQWAPG